MRKNNVMGVVFSNLNEQLLPQLTNSRSMASVPFGGRYRLIDFALSNLVNAGIGKVGVITKENYQSLMDHIGSAKSWDLDRKNGGLYILPPYGRNNYSGMYRGKIDALLGIYQFLENSQEQYIVLYDANSVMNIDIGKMVDQHIKSEADMTIAYKNGRMPIDPNVMALEFSGDRVSRVIVPETEYPDCNYSLGVIVVSRTLLMSFVSSASAENKYHFARDIIMPHVQNLVIRGYEFSGFSAVMDSAQTYVSANMSLFDKSVRNDLFNRSRPIYTKVKDAMPTRYGVSSKVNNCLIADGCVIEGTVKNSILFRGVKVEKGATLENCIVMQGSQIGSNASLKYVTIDKGATINGNRELYGAPSYYIFIQKGANV